MQYTERSADVAYNIAAALAECKKKREKCLTFPKGEYHIFRERASETVGSVSNHSHPGYKRCVFLLDGFEDFTVDGGGSTFILEDILTPVILSGSKNITFKNCSFISKKTASAQFKVLRSGEGTLDLSVEEGEVFAHGGDLFIGNGREANDRLRVINAYDENCNMALHLNDVYLGLGGKPVRFSALGDGVFHAEGVPHTLPAGYKLVMRAGTRCAAGIFLRCSTNVRVEDVTVYSGIGMALIAQNCDTVTLDRFHTRQLPNRPYSVNADGTHFVHCKGRITVENCFFEGQMDDALNIHSIYLKIIDKTDRSILVKYVHEEQKGIDIVKPGDLLEISDPSTLLPNGQYEVTDVRVLNLDVSEIFLKGGAKDIRVGDVADEISWVPDLLFRNCTVRNNRARGMLLASRGKTEIVDNLFCTPGVAVKFESDGKYWYESGSTRDVLIARNTFENCNYVPRWGDSQIVIAPRESTEEGRYYHGRIEVSCNTFKGCHGKIASIHNVAHFIFRDNILENCESEDVVCEHCGKIEK